MNNINILWVDDEIDLLKPHIIFLEQKNYNVTTCNSGTEALEILNEKNFGIVFLDFKAGFYGSRFPYWWTGRSYGLIPD